MKIDLQHLPTDVAEVIMAIVKGETAGLKLSTDFDTRSYILTGTATEYNMAFSLEVQPKRERAHHPLDLFFGKVLSNVFGPENQPEISDERKAMSDANQENFMPPEVPKIKTGLEKQPEEPAKPSTSSEEEYDFSTDNVDLSQYGTSEFVQLRRFKVQTLHDKGIAIRKIAEILNVRESAVRDDIKQLGIKGLIE